MRRSVEDPVFDAEVNVLGTIRVAQASALAGVAQVVFSSSGGAIYGDPVGERADEEHPLNPCSAYGVAKLAGEKYLAALAPDAGYLLTILRYANVYGPRQDGRGEAGVIGIWMNRLLSGQDAVVNGDGRTDARLRSRRRRRGGEPGGLPPPRPGDLQRRDRRRNEPDGALPPRRQRLRNRRSSALRPRQARRAAQERPRPCRVRGPHSAWPRSSRWPRGCAPRRSGSVSTGPSRASADGRQEAIGGESVGAGTRGWAASRGRPVRRITTTVRSSSAGRPALKSLTADMTFSTVSFADLFL